MRDPTDDDRPAILARRARFLRLALAGITTASTATACACLSPSYDAGTASQDAGTGASDDVASEAGTDDAAP